MPISWFRPPPWTPRVLLALTPLAALLFTACGGGGGGAAPLIPRVGVAGTVFLEGFDLGRVGEQEPNDSRTQSFLLAPVAARTRLEVTGEIGVSPARFGRTDLTDAFRYECMSDQDVRLELSFAEIDPVSAGSNDLSVTVFLGNGGGVLAMTTGTTSPLITNFAIGAGERVDVVVACASGHTAYVLSLDATDVSMAQVAAREGTDPAPVPPAGTRDPLPVGPCADGHVLVRLREGASPGDVAARFGLRLGRRTATGSYCLELPTPMSPHSLRADASTLCRGLEADPDVAWAHPDWLVQTLGLSDDPELPRQWNVRGTGATAAWDVTEGDPSVIIGVVDTGIVAHPDLDSRVVDGFDFISVAGFAGDGDGRDPDPTDVGDQALGSGMSSWHGTHVAGIAVARRGDGYGIAGVAPGCRVMPLRAIGRGGGLLSDVSDAILYGAAIYAPPGFPPLDEPLPVMNLSFGLLQPAPELEAACDMAAAAGVLLIASTGNDGSSGVLAPARYPSVLAVGATDGRLDRASYTNFGPEVDLVAPGGSTADDFAGDGWPDGVLSCVLDDSVSPPVPSHGYLSGTSQAAPHVAGAAALLLSVDPDLTNVELGNLLKTNAADRGAPGRDDVFGFGILQVHESLRRLNENLGMPPPGGPQLLLASGTVSLQNASAVDLAMMNVGGGVLEILSTEVETDDGAPWLSAGVISGDSRTQMGRGIGITVDRAAVAAPLGRFSGTVFVTSVTGDLGSIRVTMFKNETLHAGRMFRVVARDALTRTARILGSVRPTQGYRYILYDLPPAPYFVFAGQDLDGNGFFCEEGDACGYYGGPTEEEATTITVDGTTPVPGVDIILFAPP
ncbi:MAG: S8 family serine peptidase [Planctomycetota bacterium]|jgi:serine protease